MPLRGKCPDPPRPDGTGLVFNRSYASATATRAELFIEAIGHTRRPFDGYRSNHDARVGYSRRSFVVGRSLLIEHGQVIGVVVDHDKPNDPMACARYADAKRTVRCRIEVELRDANLPVFVNCTISLGWAGSGLTASPSLVIKSPFRREYQAQWAAQMFVLEVVLPGPDDPVLVRASGLRPTKTYPA